MKNTTKLLTIAALTTVIAGTSMSFASDTTAKKVDREQVRTLMQKVKSGETLTEIEKTTLENVRKNFKWSKFQNRFNKFKKIWNNLTDEEKTALKSMSDEQKKEFFTKKREEKKLEKETHRKVIDKLLAWETLTTEEENLRAEIIRKRAERQKNREEMRAKREQVKIILDKKKAGETLTDEEQATLNEMPRKWGKMKRGFSRNDI